MNTVITRLGLLGLSLAFTANAMAADYKCDNILAWANKGWQLEKNARGTLHTGKRFISVLQDEHFVPVFDKTLSEIEEPAINAMKETLNACWNEARSRMQVASKKGDKETVKKYSEANNFLNIIFKIRVADRFPENFKNILAHQKNILAKRVEAIASSKEMIQQARSLAASTDGLIAVGRMKEPEFLRYLDEKQKQDYLNQLSAIETQLRKELLQQQIAAFDEYEASLEGLEAFILSRKQNRRNLERGIASNNREVEQAAYAKMQQLSEDAITDAVEQLNGFSLSLEGLEALVTFHKRVSLVLQQAKAMGNHRFNKAYKMRLNELAEASYPEFKQRLMAYEVSNESLTSINRAVQELFPQQPLPDNIALYRQAASNQAEVLQDLLVKKVCYASVSEEVIESDDLELPLLDGRGASTLGLFVCQLTDSHYELLSYQGAGIFGSTHSLKVKTPRGITLTIEMEYLEVNEGEDLLVGVMAKDASEERQFSLAQWQDYAQRLTM